MRRIAVCLALAALVGSAAPALAARAVVSAPRVVSGARVIVLGTGFAPPIEFCTPVRLLVDGRLSPRRALVTDDAGGWVFRTPASGALGRHSVTLRQTCESGESGARRTARARATFRVAR